MSRGRWIVRGRVQGVGFRYATQQRASALGLACTVWNRDDGAVECTADGPDDRLAELERWLHQGPPLARVETVERLAG
ncbi:MAG TPA: acylphosphatase [Candidatus Limnocylindria bacterium]|nr:acylphosphatase [Candidatus Limnocylindria bacterium]